MNNLILDVRNSDEVARIRYPDSKNVLYLPAGMIKYNLSFLKEYFKQFESILIICQSGKRSQEVKDKYFSNNENVQVSNDQFNTIDPSLTKKTPGYHFSLTRKIQMISGTLILLLSLGTLYKENVKYAFFLLGLFMIYVGWSGNCFMSSFLNAGEI